MHATALRFVRTPKTTPPYFVLSSVSTPDKTKPLDNTQTAKDFVFTTETKEPSKRKRQAKSTLDLVSRDLLEWLEIFGIFMSKDIKELSSEIQTGIPFVTFITTLCNDDRIRGTNTKATSPAAFRQNWSKCLQYLREDHRFAEMDTRHLYDLEDLIHGDVTVFLEIVADVKVVTASFRPFTDRIDLLTNRKKKSEQAMQKKGISTDGRSTYEPFTIEKPPPPVPHEDERWPYPDDEVDRLQRSLIHWLFTLGVLPHEALQEGGSLPTTIDPIVDGVRTGVLLCHIVEAALRVKLTRQFEPKTEAMKRHNIAEAVKKLKETHNMSQRCVQHTDVESILHGDRVTIACLLEDLHRVVDKKPPHLSNEPARKQHPYVPFDDDTLYPAAPPQPQPVPAVQSPQPLPLGNQTRANAVAASSVAGTNSAWISASGFMIDDSTASESTMAGRDAPDIYSALDSVMANLPALSSTGPTVEPTEMRLDVPQPVEPFCGDVADPIPFMSTSDPTLDFIGPPVINAEESSARIPRSQLAITNGVTAGGLGTGSEDPERHTLNADGEVVVPTEGFILAEWMARLGVRVPENQFFLESETIPEMADGLILVQLVEALQMADIPNVSRAPKRRAEGLRNIRLALSVLEDNPRFKDPAVTAEDVLEGGREGIIKLLLAARKAYPTKLLKLYKDQREPRRSRA
ncbi:Calponin [Carpediemonas membranifera]|uniref:Calponin n=1 Tax=Carpediemonas membranifera TaxID=201153 RepID=A0A8J6E098_9EUKA|nr:Calponin [Carpediemonas membranifera]|eukprot:KAG9391511.1 Calponin [Carpediemonas membranifera]